MVNLSGPAQLFLKMVMPLMTEAVREKIHVVPSAHEKKIEMLTKLIGSEFIPKWLGGQDDYTFDVQQYYKESVLVTEEEGRDYFTTMPYHA